MNCEQCGAPVESESNFCASCGNMMNVNGEVVTCQSSANTNDEATTVLTDTHVIPEPSTKDGLKMHAQEQSSNQENKNPGELSEKRRKPLSLIQSTLLVIVTLIPILNMIMLLIWSFKKNTNVNRQNIARAILIVALVSFIIYIVLGGKVFDAGANI